MQLETLIRNIGVLDVSGPLNREISGLAYDVRRVVPGSAFVATPTHLGDGHQHIEEAVARGAVAIICQHNAVRRHRATCVEVRDSKLALAEASRIFYLDPSSSLKVIALVGGQSRGATTHILKQLLEHNGIRTGVIGSIRHEIGDRRLPAGRHFPEGLEINSMLAEMVRAECRASIIELDYADLGNRALSGVKLSGLVFANIGTARTLLGKGYTQQSAHTSRNMSVGQKEKCPIIRIDSPCGGASSKNDAVEVLLNSDSESATIRATHLHLGSKKTTFQLVLGGMQIPCKIPLVGRHNVGAVLAAVAAAFSLKLDPISIATGLNKLSPLPGNMEAVSENAAFQVYVDGASNSPALSEVLQSLREITPGRVLLVLGASSRTTARERFDLGKVAGESAEFTVLTADDPAGEQSAEIAATMAQGLDQTRGVQFLFEEDRAQAIMRAISLAQPGDSVLIAGKGERTCQEFADTIIPFDDRDCARECLESFVTELSPGRFNFHALA